MKLIAAGLTIAIFTCNYCTALPPNKEHKDRVLDVKLSDEEHEVNGEHNPDYDHEAFMGKEAEEFDELTPEESKKRLGLIVDKIDKDRDGFVTEAELQQWIQYVQKKYVMEDTERMWKDHDLDSDDKVTWESYRQRTFGYEYEPDEEEDYAEMVKRDERKFKTADVDGDGKLSKEEFAAFLHPEEHEHMKDIVVKETMEDIDKDKDGKISLEEYIGDMWPNKEEEEPDWVKGERTQFSTYRDADGDGFMSHEEVKNWIIPPNYDHSEAEAKHLIYEADGDKDGMLTKQEILDKYDVFVGSQATDFGDALNRHDEF